MFSLNFVDSATFAMEKVVELHHTIQFYLIIVLFLVFWMMLSIISEFGFKMYFSAESTTTSVVKTFFNRISNLKLRQILHGTALEIIWTTLPTFILFLIAVPSFSLLYLMDYSEDCVHLTVKVIGHQWYWSYEMHNSDFSNYFTFDSYLVNEESLVFGTPRLLTVDNSLFLPVNTPIRFLISSTDVLHCWAIPAFGLKVDAVPGRLNQASVVVRREGVFYGQCSELCGVNHGFMPIAVYAVDLESFNKWTAKQEGTAPINFG